MENSCITVSYYITGNSDSQMTSFEFIMALSLQITMKAILKDALYDLG